MRGRAAAALRWDPNCRSAAGGSLLLIALFVMQRRAGVERRIESALVPIMTTAADTQPVNKHHHWR